MIKISAFIEDAGDSVVTVFKTAAPDARMTNTIVVGRKGLTYISESQSFLLNTMERIGPSGKRKKTHQADPHGVGITPNSDLMAAAFNLTNAALRTLKHGYDLCMTVGNGQRRPTI